MTKMIAKLLANRVRRMYLGGGRIDEFCGVSTDVLDGVPRPEDWLASTTQAFNGAIEIDGEGLGRLEDGRLVKDATCHSGAPDRAMCEAAFQF